MHRLFKIFFTIQSARLGLEIDKPFNSLLEFLGTIGFFFLHLFSFSLIIQKFSFPFWSSDELWILLLTSQIFVYLCFFLFWQGLKRTVDDIRYGRFDAILSKPAPSRLIAFFRSGGLHNILAVILGFIFLIYFLYAHHLPFTLFSLVLYVLSLGLSTWIFHCISVLLISLNFHFGHLPGTAAGAYTTQELYKYPAGIYIRSNLLVMLLVYPLALLTTIPVTLLLSKPTSIIHFCIYIFVAIIITLISQRVWTSSLRLYSSASS